MVEDVESEVDIERVDSRSLGSRKAKLQRARDTAYLIALNLEKKKPPRPSRPVCSGNYDHLSQDKLGIYLAS